MAKAKRGGVLTLSANDLLTGAIVYWTGADWSRRPSDALRAGDEAAHAALEEVRQREEAANRVVAGLLVPVDPITGTPIALRERHREAGPSIAIPSA